MTKRETEDLLTLIEHARRDIDYGWGGTYGGLNYANGEERIDERAIRRAERAIDYIKRHILTTT